jgi:hypothetical protein
MNHQYTRDTKFMLCNFVKFKNPKGGTSPRSQYNFTKNLRTTLTSLIRKISKNQNRQNTKKSPMPANLLASTYTLTDVSCTTANVGSKDCCTYPTHSHMRTVLATPHVWICCTFLFTHRPVYGLSVQFSTHMCKLYGLFTRATVLFLQHVRIATSISPSHVTSHVCPPWLKKKPSLTVTETKNPPANPRPDLP